MQIADTINWTRNTDIDMYVDGSSTDNKCWSSERF
jgi:hypothetical protein